MVWISTAMLSLLLVGLQPARLVETTPEMAVLLTDHSSDKTLDSLKKAHPGIAVFQLGHTQNAAKPIPDVSFIQHHHPDIRQLLVLGNGLQPHDLAALENYQAQLLLNPLPEGITTLGYTEKVIGGKNFRIEGEFHHTSKKPRKLILESPAGTREILSVEKAGPHWFAAAIPTKVPGRYLFKLRTEGGEKQILEEQVLPVVITQPEKPDLLIVNAAPSFETNYLKNWLADAGYRVAVRSQISRNKFRTAFYNREGLPIQELSLAELEQFDLLILSTYTLQKLPVSERQRLQQVVKAGLGLCLLAETPFPPPELLRADRQFFLNFPFATGSDTWSVGQGTTLEKIPRQIGQGVGVSALANGDGNEIIAATRLQGNGRIALNLVINTYQQLLKGQEEAYQRFWTPILEETARSVAAPHELFLPENPVLLPHTPITFDLWSNLGKPVVHVLGPDSLNTPVFFRQQAFDARRWTAQFWPKVHGWHGGTVHGERSRVDGGGRGDFDVENDEEHQEWFYVQEADAWQSLKTARLLRENQRWMAAHPPNSNEVADTVKVSMPYPQWWFYVSFLLAAGILWLEEKSLA